MQELNVMFKYTLAEKCFWNLPVHLKLNIDFPVQFQKYFMIQTHEGVLSWSIGPFLSECLWVYKSRNASKKLQMCGIEKCHTFTCPN